MFQSYWAEKFMVHIYGHSWPVRWGEPDEEKLVKVYSNSAEVELFVNGRSAGIKKRNSQDFPAAGLRWLVKFREGENLIRAVGEDLIADEIKFVYQTQKWDKPARLLLREIANGVEVKLVDAKGVQCLDARNFVRFSLAGDGELIDNLGTSTAARKVQLYNGRAQIGVKSRGRWVVSVSSEGLPTEIISRG